VRCVGKARNEHTMRKLTFASIAGAALVASGAARARPGHAVEAVAVSGRRKPASRSVLSRDHAGMRAIWWTRSRRLRTQSCGLIVRVTTDAPPRFRSPAVKPYGEDDRAPRTPAMANSVGGTLRPGAFVADEVIE
jgi:hypothetical protein